MITENPPFHRQFRRVEARYRRAVNQGWYRPDLGSITQSMTRPVWAYSTWAPFDINLVGSASNEYIVLADNTYVGSFAYNLAKIQLGAGLFPDDDDYVDLMVGNLKKFIAEQQYFVAGDRQSMQWVMEYMIEYNARNRALDTRFRENPDGRALLHLLSSCATFSLLLHEVGHIVYGVGDYKLRQREAIQKQIDAVLGEGRTLPRLEEEAFCDVFAVVNAVGVISQEGWEYQSLCSVCLYTLLGAVMCVKTRELADAANNPGSTVTLNPTRDVLMARYEVTSRVIREALLTDEHWPRSGTRRFPFNGDELDLRGLWFKALEMPVRDPEIRNLAIIFASAFANPNTGGFAHVMQSLNKMMPIAQPSEATGADDLAQAQSV